MNLIEPRWEMPVARPPVTETKVALTKTPDALQLVFTHAGIERTLNKHPAIRVALSAGKLNIAEARLKRWFLRLKIGERERTFKLPANDKDAIRAAKDILNGRVEHASEFAAFIAERDAKRGLTLEKIAEDWFTAGLPFSKTKIRKPEAAARLRETVTRALKWWGNRNPAAIKPDTMADYVVYRRANKRATKNSTGSRSADLELGALSSLCQWAVITGRIEKNPFETRETFCANDEISHCHEAMPDNDEQFHRVLNWLFTHDYKNSTLGPNRRREAVFHARVAGAWLAFTALTGLRPGEPRNLLRVLPVTQFPPNLGVQPLGLIYPLPDGSRRMKIARTKRGQNPAVVIHPALADFLLYWHSWLYQHCPQSETLFPALEENRIIKLLAHVCRKLEIKIMKPHGFGRAYYVRVRRSQGTDDVAISVELGQSSNGKLIRDVYGDPMDPVGGNLHDWLPHHSQPAWYALKSEIGYISDTSVKQHDTATCGNIDNS